MKICNNEYPLGTFHIHKTTLWCELQPSYMSAHDGGCAARENVAVYLDEIILKG